MRRLRLLLIGAALAYFFDPENGKARRDALVKRLAELRRDRVSKPDLSQDLAEQTQAVGVE
ncbi:MAG TPA: hypothetical protein VFK62_01935 [Gaiellaceae bacterium]|jgi:uncharacterized protein (DUF58 family)|nr:hypothetical protein [Gaiellaceae bacterium]